MSTRLARSAGLISIATMASRVLGVVRETVVAAIFGAGSGPDMDAWNLAFRVPNLVRDLFAEGAMTAAFVPTFTATLAERGRAAAWRLGNLVINALLLVTAALVLLGIVFARPLTNAMAAAPFTEVPGKLDLTVLLTRLTLPFLTTIAVAAALMGMLNSLRRFFVPALSPAMFNVATIAAALGLVPLMPRIGLPPVAGLAIGALLGGLGQIAIQWPALRREGFRYEPVADFSDPGLRRILHLMIPGTLGLAAVQINVFVNTYLATTQEQCAVSWLNYAFRLIYLPIGLFGVSIATAAIPDIARHAAAGDRAAVRGTLSQSLRMMLMLNVPATVGLMALAHPIIAVLLERGRFGPADTEATAAALLCYAPGLLGYAMVKIAAPTFYALHDGRTPVLASVAAVAVNLVLNLTLVHVIGFRGLALGTALSAIVNAGLLLWLLGARLDGLEARRIWIAFGKIAAASTVMGAAAWGIDRALQGPWPAHALVVRHLDVYLALRLAASVAIGVAVLAGTARLLRIDEFDEALRRLAARLAPRAADGASG
jgi:putative peptidoglycan lipid II flippase